MQHPFQAFMGISPTAQIVEVVNKSGAVAHARVWEGETAGGTRVQVLIMRVAAHKDEEQGELERALHEVPPPDADDSRPRAFDLRMII